MRVTFFEKSKSSNIVKAGGPSKAEQLSSMINNAYWTVLNASLLQRAAADKDLLYRVNALKAALQTYGPTSSKLPDFRHNTKGSAKGHIFHGHAKNSAGTIYVLEWTVLCAEKQIIALIGFGTHENYRYRQNPLNATEVEKILGCTESKQIIERVANKIDQAKAKVLRTNYNYRLNN